ncbi:hypothetical protein [Lacinutrix mariniflava]|uniref:hypothetical protein n=1 Tax=Lacinutrix mariniflava TaxID=342955 RepID=UPI000A490D44|nr:hypothetical protein [Lacinutrix mariniflava]
MKKTEELIKKSKGLEIKISSYSEFSEFTNEKIDMYKKGGLLPNECRTNSQSVARFLRGNSLVIEGIVITPELLCFEHMWVKKDNIHIDLSLEIFGTFSKKNRYFELNSYDSKEYAFPNELSFSEITNPVIDQFYKEHTKLKNEYLKLKNALNN